MVSDFLMDILLVKMILLGYGKSKELGGSQS